MYDYGSSEENKKHYGQVCFISREEYSQLCLRQTPLGPALSVRSRGVRLIESQIKGVKKGRDQL